MIECISKKNFVILAVQHTITNEFHIFKPFEIENVGQGHGREKWDLFHSITNECVLLNFINFSFQQHENEQIFNI